MQEPQETRVQSLSWEDPLEKGMATHSSAWKIPWTEEPGGLQSMESQRVRQNLVTKQQNDNTDTFWGVTSGGVPLGRSLGGC